LLDCLRDCPDERTICGRALQQGERVIVQDILNDPELVVERPVAEASGYRAGQSTPLFGHRGEPLGTISIFFRRPHRPLERELRFTDLMPGWPPNSWRAAGGGVVARQRGTSAAPGGRGKDYAIFMLDEAGRVVTWNKGRSA